MLDSIIRETGNSRYLRTVAGIKQLCPDYDAFLAMLVRGEFPVDFAGINTDGWSQLGTALNKANLLTDATAALAGLGPDASPNEMLAALANAVSAAKDAADTARSIATAAQSTASSAQSTASSAQSTASSAQSTANSANNKITYGTSDLVAGSSNLTTGSIYVRYE